MKITDLILTLFTWQVPQGRYPGLAVGYGDREMGVVTIQR